jgi:hypothetical protein
MLKIIRVYSPLGRLVGEEYSEDGEMIRDKNAITLIALA